MQQLLQFLVVTSDMSIIMGAEILRASLAIAIGKVAASLHLCVFGYQCPWGSLLSIGCVGRSMVEGVNVVGSQITYRLRCVGQWG